MSIGIYKLTSPSGKVYIGQSKNIKKRFYQYRKLNCKTQTKLFNAIKKYGWDSFSKEIILTFGKFTPKTQQCLNSREIYFIKKYNSVDSGYNLMSGGKGGSHSLETRIKIGIGNKGKIVSKETRLKQSSSLKGRKISDKNKEVVSKIKSKVILQFDKNMNFIKQWDSIRSANLGLNINKKSTAITNNLKGRSKTAYGFIWKYKYN